jgi:hypothetical protein
MEAYEGMEVWLHAFLISILEGGEWSVSRSGRFTPVAVKIKVKSMEKLKKPTHHTMRIV